MGALDKEGQGPWDPVIELEPWRWGVLRRELHRDPSWKYLSPPTHSPGWGHSHLLRLIQLVTISVNPPASQHGGRDWRDRGGEQGTPPAPAPLLPVGFGSLDT